MTLQVNPDYYFVTKEDEGVNFLISLSPHNLEFYMDIGPSDLDEWTQFVTNIKSNQPSNFTRGNSSISYHLNLNIVGGSVVTFESSIIGGNVLINVSPDKCILGFEKLSEDMKM